MRDNLTRLALVAAASGLLFAGCGGGETAATDSTTTTDGPQATLVAAKLALPTGCYVIVFLDEAATPAQTRHVRFLLLSNPRIVTVAYVSKRLALRRYAHSNPAFAAGMKVNLFPNSFEAVPRRRLDVFSIITDFAAGVPAVVNAKPSRACPQA